MKKLKLEELGRLSPEQFQSSEKLKLCVVLDDIRSALNVGSVFRSSDAFAIEHIYLCGITARPPHKEINKTAIGATDSVSWSYHQDVNQCILELKDFGYTTIAVEQTDNSVSLDSFDFHSLGQPIVLVFGNEVNGVSDNILPIMDHAIEIPQYGTKHSLNVSVCAGILLWECNKQLRR